MNSYGDVIDALLDTLEQSYDIREGLLKYRGLLEFFTDPENTEIVKDCVIAVGRKKDFLEDKEHCKNYILKALENTMKKADIK